MKAQDQTTLTTEQQVEAILQIVAKNGERMVYAGSPLWESSSPEVFSVYHLLEDANRAIVRAVSEGFGELIVTGKIAYSEAAKHGVARWTPFEVRATVTVVPVASEAPDEEYTVSIQWGIPHLKPVLVEPPESSPMNVMPPALPPAPPPPLVSPPPSTDSATAD